MGQVIRLDKDCSPTDATQSRPYPQDKVLNSKGNRGPVVWLGWLCANPYLHLNPNTRTWFLIAETRDLKLHLLGQYVVLSLPQSN